MTGKTTATYETLKAAEAARDAALATERALARSSTPDGVSNESSAAGIAAASAVSDWADAMRAHAKAVEAAHLGLDQAELDFRDLAAIADFQPERI